MHLYKVYAIRATDAGKYQPLPSNGLKEPLRIGVVETASSVPRSRQSTHLYKVYAIRAGDAGGKIPSPSQQWVSEPFRRGVVDGAFTWECAS
jgi:hypothetical protein